MVVLGLGSDVICGLVKMPVIHRESAIAPLPVEAFVVALIQGLDPLAAMGLDVLDELGEGHGFGQVGEDVDVVADAADGDKDGFHVGDAAADVGKDLRQVLVAYLHAGAFDVEDDVDVVLYE